MDPREDLIRHYRWLRQYGLNDSHSGNASVRDGDKCWITPTGACADTLEPHDLVACPLEGPPPKGASGDAPLHLAVYGMNPEAGAVIHSHGPHVLALTLDGRDFFPRDFEGQYYFPRVPVIQVAFERYWEDSPGRVAETLADHPVCLVAGHGAYAQAGSLNLAYKWTCSLEMSAKTALLARLAGTLAEK
jgi:L-fuculose-phosphate aldolase